MWTGYKLHGEEKLCVPHLSPVYSILLHYHENQTRKHVGSLFLDTLIFFGSADITESVVLTLVNGDVNTSEIRTEKCFQSFRHSAMLNYHTLQRSCWKRIMPWENERWRRRGSNWIILLRFLFGIIKSLWLEGNAKVIQSNHQPITTTPTNHSPQKLRKFEKWRSNCELTAVGQLNTSRCVTSRQKSINVWVWKDRNEKKEDSIFKSEHKSQEQDRGTHASTMIRKLHLPHQQLPSPHQEDSNTSEQSCLYWRMYFQKPISETDNYSKQKRKDRDSSNGAWHEWNEANFWSTGQSHST